MLTVLETLGPTERAVFVLREVFDVPYDEVAAAVAKTPAAVRQIAHRAKAHVAARRPRVAVDAGEKQMVVERFREAVRTGDLQALLDVLAPDVLLVADGGGVVSAARRPITGAEKVARFLAQLGRIAPGAVLGSMWINGEPAIRIDLEGVLDTVVSMVVEDGRISRIYSVRNPEKLTRLDAEAQLAR
jgi:RNA polymerase sigma-70 factor (ECF subfamily)